MVLVYSQINLFKRMQIPQQTPLFIWKYTVIFYLMSPVFLSLGSITTAIECFQCFFLTLVPLTPFDLSILLYLCCTFCYVLEIQDRVTLTCEFISSLPFHRIINLFIIHTINLIFILVPGSLGRHKHIYHVDKSNYNRSKEMNKQMKVPHKLNGEGHLS